MILLSDANVLIDLYVVDGLTVATKIAPVEVLDSVLVEIENKHQPGITEQIRIASISVVQVLDHWVIEATKIQFLGLSLQDKLNLHYARKNERTLLTGDGRLRKLCSDEGTAVFGTLWIIDQALTNKLADPQVLCRWLKRLSEPDRFLPASELNKRIKELGC